MAPDLCSLGPRSWMLESDFLDPRSLWASISSSLKQELLTHAAAGLSLGEVLLCKTNLGVTGPPPRGGPSGAPAPQALRAQAIGPERAARAPMGSSAWGAGRTPLVGRGPGPSESRVPCVARPVRPRHGPGALPGPAVPTLPRHLHLRQEEPHPLRAAHRGPAQRWTPCLPGFGGPRGGDGEGRSGEPLPEPHPSCGQPPGRSEIWGSPDLAGSLEWTTRSGGLSRSRVKERGGGHMRNAGTWRTGATTRHGDRDWVKRQGQEERNLGGCLGEGQSKSLHCGPSC